MLLGQKNNNFKVMFCDLVNWVFLQKHSQNSDLLIIAIMVSQPYFISAFLYPGDNSQASSVTVCIHPSVFVTEHGGK